MIILVRFHILVITVDHSVVLVTRHIYSNQHKTNITAFDYWNYWRHSHHLYIHHHPPVSVGNLLHIQMYVDIHHARSMIHINYDCYCWCLILIFITSCAHTNIFSLLSSSTIHTLIQSISTHYYHYFSHYYRCNHINRVLISWSKLA